MNWRHGEFDFRSERNLRRESDGADLGDDVDGYWKIARVFEMIEPRVELHEDKFPVSYELTLEQFRELMEKRVARWV